MDLVSAPPADWRHRIAPKILKLGRPAAWLGAIWGALTAAYLSLFEPSMRGDPIALKLTFIPVLAAFTAYWFWSGLFAAPAGWAEGGRIASRMRDYLDTHSRTSWFLGIIGWIIVLLWVRTALPMIAAMLYGPFGGGLREYHHYKRLAAPHMPSTAA